MGCIYKVAHNPLGTVPNVPLASYPGKELHPTTLSMLEMNGGEVNRERDMGTTVECWYEQK